MTRRMLPESIWLDMADVFADLDGRHDAFLRVVRKALPEHAFGFVNGGVA
jgi:hypothetical protein